MTHFTFRCFFLSTAFSLIVKIYIYIYKTFYKACKQTLSKISFFFSSHITVSTKYIEITLRLFHNIAFLLTQNHYFHLHLQSFNKLHKQMTHLQELHMEMTLNKRNKVRSRASAKFLHEQVNNQKSKKHHNSTRNGNND